MSDNKSGAQTKKNTSLVQRTTLIIAMFAGFIFPFTASSMNIAVPIIGEEFSVAATHLSWIVSALMLTSIALSVPFGRFADLWGKRRIFNIGIFIFFVATLMIAFTPTPNFAYLIAFRVVQGIGAAMLVSTNNAILLDVYPASKRGSVLGLSVMATYTGLACGPIFSGFIVEHMGWRAVFTFTALFTLAVFFIAIISSRKLLGDKVVEKNTPHLAAQGDLQVVARSAVVASSAPTQIVAQGDLQVAAASAQDDASSHTIHKKDLPISPANTLLYMLAVLSSMYGLTTFSQNIFSYVCLGVGLVLFIVFAKHAGALSNPVVDLRLFKGNLRYVSANIVTMLQYTATFAIGYIMSIYLQVVKGFPADIAGMILIAQPLMMAIISPIVGRLSDKRSPFVISSIGMGMCAVAMFSLLTINADASLIHIIINLLVVGVGFGIFSSPNTNAVLSCVRPKDYGLANSILGTMRSSGQLISMAIITIVTHFTIGNVLIEDAGTTGIMLTFRVAFLVFGIVCAVGVVLSLLRTRSPVKQMGREANKGTVPLSAPVDTPEGKETDSLLAAESDSSRARFGHLPS